MSKHVALVTYSKLPDLAVEDKLLINPFGNLGYEVMAVSWNKKGVNWGEFNAVVLRSCWDYHLRFEEFNRWLDELEKIRVEVWNPIPVIRWNADKKYLLDLQKEGINVVPSIFIPKISDSSTPGEPLYAGHPRGVLSLLQKYGWEEAVVKPTVGASSYEVFYVNKQDSKRKQKQLENLLAKSDVLMQKFIPEIKTEGEWSLVFLGGKYSHSALKKPQSGEFRVNYGLREIFERRKPPPFLIEQAKKVIQAAKTPLLYARVDMVISEDKPLLMELELIEPQLFLDKESATVFAETFISFSKRYKAG